MNGLFPTIPWWFWWVLLFIALLSGLAIVLSFLFVNEVESSETTKEANDRLMELREDTKAYREKHPIRTTKSASGFEKVQKR